MTVARRYTKNSRGPGQDGIPVKTDARRGDLVLCACGFWRPAHIENHAPRMVNGGKRDCQGRAC